jgi:hypothetical protein
MALIPRRNPLTSLLNFAADRDREANSIGDIITQIAGPALGQMGVKTEETAQPAVMRGPVPTAQPLGAMTGPAMAPTPVMSDEELKANVFPGESGGDYNALFGYANRPGKPFEGVKLTDMTVNEVLDFTKPSGPYGQWVKSQIGRVSTPTGAFQTVGTTLKDAVQGLGLTGDEPYNEATQDAVGRWIFENQGPEAWEAWGKSGGTVSAGGGDARLGGGMGADTLGGNNVEDILAQLYPQMSPEDEKRQRRKDFFAAASQGFSALSQGRPIDFSNIRQAKEQRRTQAVNDMRERERARAAATLVLDQGGSPAMATALATGAASMGDFMTDRQLRKAQETADKQRLLDAQRTELLVPYLEAAGLSSARIAEIQAYGEEGGDITELLTFEQAAVAADEARKAEAAQEELGQEYLASDDPVKRAVGQLVVGGMSFKDAIDSATKLFPKADEAPSAVRLFDDAYQREVIEGGMPPGEFRQKYGATPLESEMLKSATAGTGQFNQTPDLLGTGTLSGKGVPLPTIVESAPDSVFNRASDATGLLSAAAQLGANTIGQASEFFGFGGMFQEEVGARQALNTFKSKVVGALGSSERGRMLAQELAMLIEEVAPAPGVFVSPETMRTRLTEIDAELRSRLAEASADVNDTALPAKDREDARRLAAGIESAIRELHAPSGVDGEEAPIPEVGETVEVDNLEGAVIVNEDGSERPLKAGEQPKPGDTVRLSNGVTIEIE